MSEDAMFLRYATGFCLGREDDSIDEMFVSVHRSYGTHLPWSVATFVPGKGLDADGMTMHGTMRDALSEGARRLAPLFANAGGFGR